MLKNNNRKAVETWKLQHTLQIYNKWLPGRSFSLLYLSGFLLFLEPWPLFWYIHILNSSYIFRSFLYKYTQTNYFIVCLFYWFCVQSRLNDSGVSSDRRVINSDLPHKVHTYSFSSLVKNIQLFLGFYFYLIKLDYIVLQSSVHCISMLIKFLLLCICEWLLINASTWNIKFGVL